MIDWMNPTSDVLEARRIGYEERDTEVADEIERLRARIELLKKQLEANNLTPWGGVDE